MKNIKQYVHLVVVSMLLSASSLAFEKSPTDLPFMLSQGYLIIAQGSIGRMEKLNFLIDTGSIPSVVDRKVAKQLGLKAEEAQVTSFGKKGQLQRAVLPELRLGPIDLRSFPVLVGDLSFLAGRRIDAIIGLDVLTRSSFSVDYDAKILSFGPVEALASSTSLHVQWPFLTVKLAVANEHLQLVVDTGSRDLVLFERRVHGRLPRMLQLSTKTIYHASGESYLKEVRLSRVDLGQSQWGSLTAFLLDASTDGYPDVDGVLGILALGAKRFNFDFQHNKLSFEK